METEAPARPLVAWAPASKPQRALLSCPAFEVFFGGARGGGKTDGILGEWAQHANGHGVNAIGLMVRRSRIQLTETFERAKAIYRPLGATFTEVPMRCVMQNGARLIFAYLERDADAENYQGHSYSRIYVEEAGNFPSPVPILKLMASLRSGAGVPCRMRLTGNPGGPGHQWVRARYIDPAPLGWEPIVDAGTGLDRVYIPSRVSDNRYLGPGYVAQLKQSGSPELVRAWLEGDWTVVAGAYFPEFDLARHVIAPRVLPQHWTRIRAFDWGSARPFCCLWIAVSDGTVAGLPSGALIVYREWYGSNGEPNTGLKMPAEAVARGILEREEPGETIRLSAIDPAGLREDGGPSIAERMRPIPWYGADNSRVAGWDQIRSRLVGMDEKPMLYVFATCLNLIRTLPALQHDERKPEDLDSDGEDHCFVKETKILTREGPVRIGDLVNRTGEVLSADGRWVAFHGARRTRINADVVRLSFSDGSIETCTPDHGFLTSHGWVKAVDLIDALRYVVVCKPSFIPPPSRSSTASGSTAVAGISSTMVAGFTGLFGRPFTGPFPMGTMSTTRTATGPTTPLETFNSFLGTIISSITGLKAGPGRNNTSQRPGSRRPSGMGARKAGHGIVSTMRKAVLACMPVFPRPVSNAGAHSMPCRTTAGFVPMPASPLGGGLPDWTTRTGFAWVAARHSPRTNTGKCNRAVGNADTASARTNAVECLRIEVAGKSDVYCLTVPDGEAFTLASGIVVHNCADSLRYGCMARPWVTPSPTPPKPADTWARAFAGESGDGDGEDWKTV